MRTIRIMLGLVAVGLAWVGVSALIDALPKHDDKVTFAYWFLGPPILSDLVLMPTVAVTGWLAARYVARWARLPLIVALVSSAALLAVSAPFLGTPGRRPDNPSLLDRDYLGGVAVFLAVIWVGLAVWAAARFVTARRGVAVGVSRAGSKE